MINFEDIKAEILKEFPQYFNYSTPDIIVSFINNELVTKFTNRYPKEYDPNDYSCGYIGNRYDFEICFQFGSDLVELDDENGKEEIIGFIDEICCDDFITSRAKKCWSKIKELL